MFAFTGVVRALWSFSRRRRFAFKEAGLPQGNSPALVDEGASCVACFLCSGACPAQCIEIEAGPDPQGIRARIPRVFSIDMGHCMQCGLCVQACPEAAIEMSEATFSESDAPAGLIATWGEQVKA